jgi:hypothetical protein
MKLPEHRVYGIISLVCALLWISPPIALAIFEGPARPSDETGIWDIPSLFWLLSYFYSSAVCSIVGFAAGLASFVLQHNTFGLGLCGFILNAIPLPGIAYVCARFLI